MFNDRVDFCHSRHILPAPPPSLCEDVRMYQSAQAPKLPRQSPEIVYKLRRSLPYDVPSTSRHLSGIGGVSYLERDD
jgi:hypothetical protein